MFKSPSNTLSSTFFPVIIKLYTALISQIVITHTHTHTHTHIYIHTQTCTYGHAQSICQVRLFATPWTIAYQAPLSIDFSKQEYWSGQPFPTPGNLPDPDPGIEPASPVSLALAGIFFTTEPPGKPYMYVCIYVYIHTYIPGLPRWYQW